MAEYISREAAVDADRRKKIKTPFAKIFVSDNPEKTYYYIMWWQDEEMQIGFGSANLLFVRQWLRDEFEVENPAADVAPVVHGQWIIGVDDDDFDVKCSKCGWADIFEVAGIAAVERIAKTMHYCLNCGARMDGGVNDNG